MHSACVNYFHQFIHNVFSEPQKQHQCIQTQRTATTSPSFSHFLEEPRLSGTPQWFSASIYTVTQEHKLVCYRTKENHLGSTQCRFTRELLIYGEKWCRSTMQQCPSCCPSLTEHTDRNYYARDMYNSIEETKYMTRAAADHQ